MPTELYLLVQEDRHQDLEFELFTDRDKAIRAARDKAAEESRGHIAETFSPCDGNDYYVVCVEYSVEGDSVWVTKLPAPTDS